MHIVDLTTLNVVEVLFGIAATSLSGMWALSKVILRALDSRFTAQEKQFETLNEDLSRIERDVHKNEKELLRLRGELPNEYVRREDWIRFSGLIDAKLDRLNDKIDIAIGVRSAN